MDKTAETQIRKCFQIKTIYDIIKHKVTHIKMILSVEETTSAMDVGIVLRPFHALCQAVFTAARRRAFLIIDKRKFQMGLWQIHERSKWF